MCFISKPGILAARMGWETQEVKGLYRYPRVLSRSGLTLWLDAEWGFPPQGWFIQVLNKVNLPRELEYLAALARSLTVKFQCLPDRPCCAGCKRWRLVILSLPADHPKLKRSWGFI